MRYNVSINGIYGTEFEVEADNEEEAADKALELFEDINNISGADMYADVANVEEIED